MPNGHPEDETLADLIDGLLNDRDADEVRRHVVECARCQMRVGEARAPISFESSSPLRAAIPIALVEERRDVVPSVGDVWRLMWDDITMLGWLRRVDPDAIAVAPIFEVEDADNRCVLVPADDSDLGAVAVGVDLERLVPWAVLDVRLASLVDRSSDSSDNQRWRRVAPSRSAIDHRAEATDEIDADLARLAEATWLTSQPQSAPVLSYDVLTGAGLEPNRALAVSARGAAPTEAEADRIAAFTGAPRPSTTPGVSEDLRRLLDSPRLKARIRSFAERHGDTEAIARLRLAANVQPQLRAARGRPGAQADDLERLIDRLLDE